MMSLPPPPGPPPGPGMSGQAQWHGGYGRMYSNGSFHMPPPPPSAQHQAYNPKMHAHIAAGATLTLPPPPPQPSEQMSATYIPHGDTYGESVGIPAFDDNSTYPASSMGGPWLMPGAMDNGNTMDDIMKNGRGSSVNSNSASSSNIPYELCQQWPMDKVLLWLAANHFSKDWQETFKALNLHGATFLELGCGHGGRGNFGIMHQQVYPRLATVCASSGTGWDQQSERDEGKRMRKLVRSIVNGKPADVSRVPSSSHSRKESLNHGSLPSAGTDPAESPNPIKAPGPGFGSRRFSQSRATTMPTLNNSTMSSDSNHRNMLKHIDTDGLRRHSPVDSDSAHHRTQGPRSGSPSASPKPQPQAMFSQTSASPHSAKFGHRSRNSTDSVSSNAAIYGSGVPPEASQLLRSGMSINEIISRSSEGRGDGRRPGQDGGRPSPQSSNFGDQSAGPGEPPSSARDKDKGFLSFLHRKKKQKEDGAFPSPDDLESPTSPQLHFKPHSLGSNAGNASEASLEIQPGSAHYDGSDALSQKTRSPRPGRLFILATMDGWNYRMCDLTEGETPKELRQIICASLGLMDAENTQIYLTELGKFEHDQALDDQKLVTQKRTKADSYGTLKFYVRPSGYIAQGTGDLNGVPASLAPGTPLLQPSDGVSRARSSSSPPSARQNITGERVDEKLYQEANEYRAEMERKQREYLAKRRQVKDATTPDSANGYSITGRSVDFDQPRNSPFEEKRMDQLLPARKPPAPPSDPSATLTKVNSLRRTVPRSNSGISTYNQRRPPTLSEESAQEGDDRGKPTSPNPGGIGAALVGMGRGLSAIGQSTANGRQYAGGSGHPQQAARDEQERGKGAMSTVNFGQTGSGRGSPRSKTGSPGTITWSRGDVPFVVPDYSPGGTLSLTKAQRDHHDLDPLADAPRAVNRQTSRDATSPDPAPAAPSARRRKSHGPDLDFEETDVKFSSPVAPAAPAPQDDGSDDDSDDGLFARSQLRHGSQRSQCPGYLMEIQIRMRSLEEACTDSRNIEVQKDSLCRLHVAKCHR